MKDFNGTVVIVDPENFIKEEDLGTKIDLGTVRFSPKLGFRSLFFVETGVGNCFLTYHRVESPREYYQNGSENYVRQAVSNAFSGYIKPKSGNISVDSGVVGVFLLEDIEKYNPGALKNLKPGQDYILINNYKGKVGYFKDKYGMIHFYGTGTTNFYTL